jgi:hypothetical protein
MIANLFLVRCRDASLSLPNFDTFKRVALHVIIGFGAYTGRVPPARLSVYPDARAVTNSSIACAVGATTNIRFPTGG